MCGQKTYIEEKREKKSLVFNLPIYYVIMVYGRVFMEQLTENYQLAEYLEKNRFKIMKSRNEEQANYILTIFASPLLDEHPVMMDVHKWFRLKLYENFSKLVRQNFHLMGDMDLSLYKFSIIIGYRGPLKIEDFDTFIAGGLMDERLTEIARHKDFPMHLKQMFYETTGDVTFLPKDAQDIFIF